MLAAFSLYIGMMYKHSTNSYINTGDGHGIALMSGVSEHFQMIKRLPGKYHAVPVMVKTVNDLADISGLIIPGGESTVIYMLLKKSGMYERIDLPSIGVSFYGYIDKVHAFHLFVACIPGNEYCACTCTHNM